jgi:hypothetical protein
MNAGQLAKQWQSQIKKKLEAGKKQKLEPEPGINLLTEQFLEELQDYFDRQDHAQVKEALRATEQARDYLRANVVGKNVIYYLALRLKSNMV